MDKKYFSDNYDSSMRYIRNKTTGDIVNRYDYDYKIETCVDLPEIWYHLHKYYEFEISNMGRLRYNKIVIQLNDLDENSDSVEEWKDFCNPNSLRNKYEISNYGRIKNKNTGDILHRYTDITDKLYTTLGMNSFLVDSFVDIQWEVAKAFITNDSCGIDIIHINGIKCDNRVSNLKWGSNGENISNQLRFVKKLKTFLRNREREIKQTLDDMFLFNGWKDLKNIVYSYVF
jgi:NUMOD4 motif